LLNYLPPVLQKNKVYKAVFNSEEQEMELLQTHLEDVEKQLYIETATWGLSYYEEELGIKTDYTKTYDERRSVVKSMWIGRGKVDRALIKLVAQAYANGKVEVDYGPTIYSADTYREDPFIPPYPIIVRFVDVMGVPPRIEDLKSVIEEIKPAHLEVQFQFRYMTWNELDAENLTWDQLDALNLTWDEFESGRWL